MKKVSVIIPVYNVEKYLRECLDSIINQTLPDIEIICINDGSTDKSGEILNEYSCKDKRIKVFYQTNQGAATARNLGISMASAEYLLILDSDDIFKPDLCEKLYKNAINYNTDITICRSESLDNQTNNITPALWTIRQKYLPEMQVFCAKDISDYIFEFCVGWSWDKLFKREFIINNKIEFQNLRSSNDLYFVFMALALANRISIVDETLITHRKNTGTQLSETRDKDPLCFIKAIIKLKEELIERNLYSDYEKSFVNWAVNFCFWHLKTIKTKKSKKIITNYLKNNISKIIDLHLDKPNFYNQIHTYIKLREFIDLKYKIIKNVFDIIKSADNPYIVITILGIKIKLKRSNANA